jgi:glycosyltransferase involved in cell wall biosynthesis
VKISFVIPTLNEEGNIAGLLSGVRKEARRLGADYEMIVVDGHSSDRTADLARRNGARVIYDSLGKGSALRAGFKEARGDVIVSIDADLSHHPKEIGMLVDAVGAGYDIAMGSRFMQGGGTADMEWYRMAGNRAFVWLTNALYGSRYSDLCYGYRAIRKSSVRKMRLTTNGFGIEAEISAEAVKRGLRTVEVPSFEKKRNSGAGKLKTFRDGVDILKIIVRKLGD